jgi:hypothetical protein
MPEAEHYPALSAELAPDVGLEPTFGSIPGFEPEPMLESPTEIEADAALGHDRPNTADSDDDLKPWRGI